MEQLTAQQAKMVLEYFAQQAAEDAPADGEWYTDLWISRFKASISVERQIGGWWWESLVEAQMELQSFDRDPEGWMHENGVTEDTEFFMRQHLENQVSWAIDNAYNNSGA